MGESRRWSLKYCHGLLDWTVITLDTDGPDRWTRVTGCQDGVGTGGKSPEDSATFPGRIRGAYEFPRKLRTGSRRDTGKARLQLMCCALRGSPRGALRFRPTESMAGGE